MNNKSKFDEALKIGRLAETDIARWLRSRGNSIITCYEIQHDTGKGPRFFAPTRAYVAPDILMFSGGGKVIWCEVKHKSVFSWHRKTRRWVTGIDLPNYRDYQRVYKQTGLPVWLLFLHIEDIPSPEDLMFGSPKRCSTGLFGGDLENLVKNENHRNSKWGRRGMVYWSEDTLNRLASLDEFRSAVRIAC